MSQIPVNAANYADDIDGQLPGNYNYDNIGNLVKDVAEQIDQISWTVYGKIERITRIAGSQKPDLEFAYSPDGHRIMKRVYHKLPGGGIDYLEETFYVRDASGNTLATYNYKHDDFTFENAMIYGSSRVGVVEVDMLLHSAGVPVPNTLPAGEIEFYRGKKEI